jgi:hypothetical protein
MEGEFARVDYKNVDSIAAVLTGANQATYKELKKDYSVQEVMEMWEAVVVPRINEWLASEHARKQRQRG